MHALAIRLSSFAVCYAAYAATPLRPALAQEGTKGVVHGQRPAGKLIIRNALVVEGNGTPTTGPFDIVLENGTIVDMVALDPVAVRNGNAKRPEGAAEIDATGKYVLPGLINIHGHIQDERGGAAQPYAYQNKLWLASGITTVRDVSAGADAKAFVELRAQSASGAIEAPRFFICAGFSARPSPRTPEQARARVQELKKIGVDCIKIVGLDRDIMSAMLDEAHKVGLPVAHHAGVEEVNAWDDIHYGTSSIEHWYGVPDAAILDRVQNFPADYNYSDEVDRFRYAGRLWREADPKRLDMVLDSMVAKGVAWNPTLVIYEASRDLTRAQNQPWFRDYLHPTLEDYFKPDPSNHGSYFLGWTTHRRGLLARELPDLDERGPRVRPERRTHRRRRGRRVHLPDVWVRSHSRARAAAGSGIPSDQGDRARHPQ